MSLFRPAQPRSSPSASAPAQPPHQSAFIAPDDSDFLESEDGDAEQDELEEDEDEEEEEQTGRHREETVTITTAYRSQSTSPKRRPVPQPVHHLLQIADRFYFAVFDHPAPSASQLNANGGTEAAVFPTEPSLLYGSWVRREYEAQVEQARARGKRRDRRWQPLPGKIPDQFHWFSIDERLQYSCFFDDWGPLNAAALFRFCTEVQNLMESKALENHGIVLYTTTDSRMKTNAATLCALRNLITDESLSPADAFHPFGEMEFQPFRDAGYGRADYFLTMQDVLYGTYRARSLNLLDMTEFNLDEYEHFEQVQHGDWNWLTPFFIAFASPNDREYVKQLHISAQQQANGMASGSASPYRKTSGYPPNCTQVIEAFKERNVRLVVRLNNPLYDKHMFVREGIDHLELYFDDGSNPSDEILRAFIDAADRIVEAKGVIAVHCKAGLGRTGVLIGAYMIWKWGFQPGEVIGLMRLMRPGCVVGPQQQFIYEKANEWVRWGAERQAMQNAEAAIQKEKDALKLEIARLQNQLKEERLLKRKSEVAEPVDSDSDAEVASMFTPRPAKMAHRGEQVAPATAAPAYKPPPCVGQPRKSPSPSRKRPAALAPATVHRMGTYRSEASGGPPKADTTRSTSNPFATDGGESPTNLFYEEIKSNVDQSSQHRGSDDQNSIQDDLAAAPDTPSRSSRISSSPKSSQLGTGSSQQLQTPPRSSPRGQVTNVLGEAHRLNMQVAPPATPPTPRGGFEKAGILGRIERVAESFAGASAGTPPSPRVLHGTARASPSVRDRYGLKDTSKVPPTSPSMHNGRVLVGEVGVLGAVQAGPTVELGAPSPVKPTVGRTAARLASATQSRAVVRTTTASSSSHTAPSTRTVSRTTVRSTSGSSTGSAASSTSGSVRSRMFGATARPRSVRPATAAATQTPSSKAVATSGPTPTIPSRYASAQPSYMNATSSSLKRSRGVTSPDLEAEVAVPAVQPSTSRSAASGRNVRARC